MPKTVEQALVLDHKTIGPLVQQMTLKAPDIARAAKPGQFVHVRVGGGHDPLLRRPLSIAAADADNGTISLIYRIVGRGTAQLGHLSYGDTVDCMGPLGSGFSLAAQRPLLVGGGIGLAPLLFLAQELCPHPVNVLMGGRSKEEMYWQHLFEDVCRNIHITTDDGSLGERGFTIDHLPALLAGGGYDFLYACGPRPMLQGVARLAKEYGIPCEISLEDHMACGVGACLSCTCAGTDGRRRKVCSDGPVFAAGEVLDL
ncbi:MAG: dihydroorotate dehydrogenase electron transfer subunit [Negativicutes bacterium]|nr:dihydroorotate dehydrogenase electron transfer subunit [Negativicutes bacterium]